MPLFKGAQSRPLPQGVNLDIPLFADVLFGWMACLFVWLELKWALLDSAGCSFGVSL